MKKIFLILALFPMIVLAQNVNLNKGLVAHYSFDGNAKDISGKKNNGILPKSGVKFKTGKFGKAANFYSKSHIKIPNKSSLKFYNEVSFSVWVKTNSSKSQTIFAKRHDRSGFYAKASYKDGKLNAMFGNNKYSSPKFSISASINNRNNNWVHIVYVFTKNKAKIYLNGNLAKTESNLNVNFSIANKNDLYIGKFNDSWYPFTGSIDDFRIYNRKLNNSEIKALYNGEKGNSESIASNDFDFTNVVYQDKQIDKEVSFTLFDENINYTGHYAYSEKTVNLFLLTENGIVQYDLSYVYNKKPTKIDFLGSTEIDNRRNGIEVNPEGTKLAYIDKQNNIHIIDIATQKEIFKKNIKKYGNYKGKSKVSEGSDFVFISNNELIIGGSKRIGILNIDKGKFKTLKFNVYDNYPTIISGKNAIFKSVGGRVNVAIFKLSDDLKHIEASSSYSREDWNFITGNNPTIKRKTDNKVLTAFFDKNDAYKIRKTVISDKSDKKGLLFSKISFFKWINNYNQLLGFKENKKGFVVYNYSNISFEIEKQYYLKAQSKNTNIAYEAFLKIYPNSTYKSLCDKKLDDFYKLEYDLVNNMNSKNNKKRVKELYKYIANYPNSNYKHNAKDDIQEIYKTEYDIISQSNNTNTLERYLSDYPKSPFKQKVKSKANAIYKEEFDKVCELNTIESYSNYNTSFPKSNYTIQVAEKIQIIEDRNREETEIYERAKADDGSSYTACIEYLNKYPNGIYVEEVKANKKVFDDKRKAIERGKNPKLWKLGNKLCIIQYEDIVLMSGTLDSWNEDKSMAKIKLNMGMWDKQGTKYRGDDLVKNNYIFIKPSDGWHICLDDEIDILEERSNMPGTVSNYSASNSGGSASAGRNCSWTETLTLENNDGSIIGSLFSSLTNISFPIKYTGVIEQEIGGNYKIIISNASVKLSGWASANQIKYKSYANEKVRKSIGQTRVKSKGSVKVY